MTFAYCVRRTFAAKTTRRCFILQVEKPADTISTFTFRCVRVADYPRGKVAAGLAVVAHLEVLAVRPGLIQETVRVIAEDGITEIVIDAEVRYSEDP